ncbi:hypothetical protein GCM10009677_61840 [Sphaerisporangium rubeum]
MEPPTGEAMVGGSSMPGKFAAGSSPGSRWTGAKRRAFDRPRPRVETSRRMAIVELY